MNNNPTADASKYKLNQIEKGLQLSKEQLRTAERTGAGKKYVDLLIHRIQVEKQKLAEAQVACTEALITPTATDLSS